MAKPLRPEGLDFVDRAPIQVRAETTIAAPAAVVWAGVADTAGWLEWFDGMKDARLTSEGPVAVGSTRTVSVPPLRVDEEIIAFDPEERFAFRFVSANLPILTAMVEVVTLQAAGTTTRVEYRQSAELAPWARALTPVLRRQLQGKVASSLVGLDRWAVTRASR